MPPTRVIGIGQSLVEVLTPCAPVAVLNSSQICLDGVEPVQKLACYTIGLPDHALRTADHTVDITWCTHIGRHKDMRHSSQETTARGPGWHYLSVTHEDHHGRQWGWHLAGPSEPTRCSGFAAGCGELGRLLKEGRRRENTKRRFHGFGCSVGVCGLWSGGVFRPLSTCVPWSPPHRCSCSAQPHSSGGSGYRGRKSSYQSLVVTSWKDTHRGELQNRSGDSWTSALTWAEEACRRGRGVLT